MTAAISPSFKNIFYKDFNLSAFIGFCLLAIHHYLTDGIAANDSSGLYRYLLVPAINGFFTALVMLLLNHLFAGKKYTALYYSQDKLKLLGVAFIAGGGVYYITFSVAATYLMTLIVMIVSVNRIRSFFSKISQLLSPHRLATADDIGTFINFFITLIISFTVTNLSLNAAHTGLVFAPAFNFGSDSSGIIDALYFSITTMTTVGYGDILPLTPLAKIVVSLECITSYLTLGIMIGIIIRGIRQKR